MQNERTTREIGDIGENAVAAYLMKNGYEILRRNYTIRGGEIDIIARKGDRLAFVEVKTRKAGSLTSGESAMTASKKKHLINTAAQFYRNYLKENKPAKCRFDVAVIELKYDKVVNAKYYVSAFDAGAAWHR